MNNQTASNDKPLTQPVSSKPRLSLENLPDLLTVREVAELLRVSPLTIKRWGKRGNCRLLELTPVVIAATKKRLSSGS